MKVDLLRNFERSEELACVDSVVGAGRLFPLMLERGFLVEFTGRWLFLPFGPLLPLLCLCLCFSILYLMYSKSSENLLSVKSSSSSSRCLARVVAAGSLRRIHEEVEVAVARVVVVAEVAEKGTEDDFGPFAVEVRSRSCSYK